MGPRFLSHVIPFYNEEESVQVVLLEVARAIRKQKIPFEIIAVDDGSSDGTWNGLLRLKQVIPELRLVKLRANFGQTKALAAGIKEARGDWILTMDGDGQNDPQDLPLLLEKAREGYAVVSGWRKNRKDGKWTRTIPSRMANALLSKITGLFLHDSGCALKLYRSEALRSISLYSDRHRFIPFLLFMRGFRVAEVVVNHRPRTRGKSKYGVSRTFKVFLDLLALALFARFQEFPRFYFFLAAIPFLIGSVAFTAQAFHQIAGIAGSQGSILYFGTAFLLVFGAVSLISFGLFAEWLTHFEREKINGTAIS